jgi:hypothetical protein
MGVSAGGFALAHALQPGTGGFALVIGVRNHERDAARRPAALGRERERSWADGWMDGWQIRILPWRARFDPHTAS